MAAPQLFSMDELLSAWERVRENDGCGGSDGVTIPRFALHLDNHLRGLLERLANAAYRPYPLLQILVEKKPNSGASRTLLVPAVRDRVLQTATARLLSHSVQLCLPPRAGRRPRRRPHPRTPFPRLPARSRRGHPRLFR